MMTRRMHAEQKSAKLQQNLTEAEEINTQLLAELDSKDSEIKRLKAKNSQLTDNVSTLRASCDEAQAEICQLEQCIESYSNLHTDLASAQDRSKFLENQLNELKKQLNEIYIEKENIELEHMVSLQDELEAENISTQHSMMTSSNKIKKYLKLSNFIKKARKNLKMLRLSQRRQPKRIKRIALCKQNEELSKKCDTMYAVFSSAQAEVEELRTHLAVSVIRCEESERNLNELSAVTSELLQLQRQNTELLGSLLDDEDVISALGLLTSEAIGGDIESEEQPTAYSSCRILPSDAPAHTDDAPSVAAPAEHTPELCAPAAGAPVTPARAGSAAAGDDPVASTRPAGARRGRRSRRGRGSRSGTNAAPRPPSSPPSLACAGTVPPAIPTQHSALSQSASTQSAALKRAQVSYAVQRGTPTAAQRFLDTCLDAIAAGRNPRDVPLSELIYHCMREHPQDIHMINGATGESFTNDRILRSAVSFAHALIARGFTGSVLMCVMSNREPLISLYYGALFAGVKVFLLDPQATRHELSHFLPLVEPNLIVCNADRFDDIKASICTYGNLSEDAVVADDKLEQFCSGHDDNPAAFKPVPVSPEACAVILPTSGSTGLPKAAEITHAGLQAQLPTLWCFHKQFPRPTERLMFMSTAQWMTFTNFLTTCPVYRITIIVSPDKTLPIILHILQTFKPTWLLQAPSSAAVLTDAATADQLAPLRNIMSTGAPLSATTLKRLATLAPQAAITDCYGSTETVGFATIANKDLPFGTIGKIINIFLYKLVDDDEKEVARGQKGELYLKGDWVIKRYVKNEAAYKECVTPDGWWKTGDIFTEDDDNNMFFVERKRFWFKYLNYQISPEELESVISGVEGVLEVVVTGNKRGAAAAVTRRPGAKVTREDIHKAVESTLSDYKRLRGGIAFVDSLPRTHSGKLHRADCNRLVDRLIEDGHCY